MVQIKDHEKMMEEALVEAKKALELGEFPVGCIIADDGQVICRTHRQHSRRHGELDHAEIVAVRMLDKRYDIHSRKNLVLYSTMEPCLMCYSTILVNNITTIVYGFEDAMGGGTGLDLKSLKPLYAQKEVTLIPHVLRKECHEVFYSFFMNEKNSYLGDSLLARYTLQQKF